MLTINTQKYRQLFLQTAKQYLWAYVTNLQNYIQKKTEVEAVSQMFIAIHSIKSQSQVMGYERLANFCIQVEQFLRELKNNPVQLSLQQIAYLQSVEKVISQELHLITQTGADHQNEDKQDETAPAVAGNSKIILLVEDDHFFEQFYSYKLRQSGFIVDVAQNGEEGLKKMMLIKPELVLLDLIMPIKDGFQVLAEKKQAEDEHMRNIPVVVFSTLGQEADIKQAMLLGATDYVNKSFFDYDTLFHKITSILGLQKSG